MKNLESIDLGLALMMTLRKEGERFTCRDIARWCGCSERAVRQIETRALRKARVALEARRMNDASGGLGRVPERYVETSEPAGRWIPLKQWLVEEADRLGVTPRAVYNRWHRCSEMRPRHQVVNARVILVHKLAA